jgi:hypothetical protein
MVKEQGTYMLNYIFKACVTERARAWGGGRGLLGRGINSIASAVQTMDTRFGPVSQTPDQGRSPTPDHWVFYNGLTAWPRVQAPDNKPANCWFSHPQQWVYYIHHGYTIPVQTRGVPPPGNYYLLRFAVTI